MEIVRSSCLTFSTVKNYHLGKAKQLPIPLKVNIAVRVWFGIDLRRLTKVLPKAIFPRFLFFLPAHKKGRIF